MAPVNQLGVLAFAAGALAVPHAQWQPFKRHAHAHASAPAGYESSYVPAYGVSSSSAGSYGSSSADPASESWSAPAYPSASGSSVEPASGSASWSAPAYPSGSSAGAFSGSGSGSAPPYPSASGSKSGWAFPTGGYGSPSSSWGTGYSAYPTGYSSYPSGYSSISVCTETSTLIWKTTTSLSTYYVTHTLYESSAAASSVSPASVSSYAPGYSAPGYSAPASAPAGGESGASCVPDVTVTETVKTTVYVTSGASSVAAVASASATPACWTACFQQAGITAESQLCGNTAVDKCIQDGCSSAEDKAYWAWYKTFCPATSSAAVSASASAVPSSAAAPSYPAAPSSASAAAPSYSAPASGGATGKRGLAYNDASLANAFAGTAASGWGYNWLSDASGLDSSIPYIPMLWGPSSDFTGTWQANAETGIANGAQYLFSFNEPDMSTQANLSPEAAAVAWKQYMEPFAGRVKLVAPAVTNGQGDGIGLSWLTQFLSACSDCTIDAVAMHWYYAGNPIDTFKSQITDMASQTGKGIWLNEFGATGSDSEKSAFLQEVMPWMDSNDSIL